MEPIFTVEKISPRTGLELGTARLVGQRLTHRATGALNQRRLRSGPEVIKLFSCSTQLSINNLNAHKYKNIKNEAFFRLINFSCS